MDYEEPRNGISSSAKEAEQPFKVSQGQDWTTDEEPKWSKIWSVILFIYCSSQHLSFEISVRLFQFAYLAAIFHHQAPTHSRTNNFSSLFWSVLRSSQSADFISWHILPDSASRHSAISYNLPASFSPAWCKPACLFHPHQKSRGQAQRLVAGVVSRCKHTFVQSCIPYSKLAGGYLDLHSKPFDFEKLALHLLL